MLPGEIDANQIYKWEKGLHRPHDDTLDAIAVALETTVATFLTDGPSGEVPTLDAVLGGGSDDDRTLGERLQRIEDQLDEIIASLLEQDAEDAHRPGEEPGDASESDAPDAP